MKGKALLAGCIALAFSNMALAEDIKVAVVGAMSGPVAQYGDQEFTGAEITRRMGILRMNMKGKALLAGCIALAFSNMALAEDIKVAVVGAMSGPVAQYGDQEFTGAEQAVADINAKGGIKGNKLQIVKYDDACDPKQAVAVANKVVNDGIKYVIGHLCSSSTQPNMALAEDIKVAVVGAKSGPVAQNGDQEFTGAEQAVADINAKGGIKGNKLQNVKYDDACDPKQAVAVANKFVNDGIKYVIGHLCSS